MKNPIILSLAATILFLTGCKKEEDDAPPTPSPAAVTVTDIDGNTYSTVTIGDQVWMTEDLRVTRYRDGSIIPTGMDDSAWWTQTSGASCSYMNDPANDSIYGRLYNWYAVDDALGLCPQGWHVATDADWQQLEATLGMPSTQLGAIGQRGEAQNVGGKLKSLELWAAPNTGATNESGFSALPNGLRHSLFGGFNFLGQLGHWWTATPTNASEAVNRDMDYDRAIVGRYNSDKRSGYCVRCLRD